MGTLEGLIGAYQDEGLDYAEAKRRAEQEMKGTSNMIDTANTNTVRNMTPGLTSMLDAAKPLAATPPKQAANPPPAAPAADVDSNKTGEVKNKADLTSEYEKLLISYKNLGNDQQKALRTSMEKINDTIKDLNTGFEMQMAEAKGKAEKDKTRAEWASIASMLAKNIVGFAAAQQGVSPNAMAYETMDWGKRIADIEANLKNDIDIFRDTMRDKVNNARNEAQGKKELSDADFKSKIASLGGRTDLYRLEAQSRADKAKAEEAKAERSAGTETVVVKPLDLKGVFEKRGKEKENDFRDRVIGKALQLGVPQTKINEILKKHQSWNDFGEPNPDVDVIQADLTDEIMKATGGTQRTVSTKKTLANGQQVEETREDVPADTGQPTTNVVQSPQPDTPLAEFNRLPSGAEYWYKGRKLRKP